MRLPKPTEGVFPNTMAYARWGEGPKTVLVAPGGPGNDAPTVGKLKWIGRSLRPLAENGYRLWMVARRRGMPPGYGTEDMADDYADLIATEFDGEVDLFVGLSYGAAVGLHMAADHSHRFGHIALVGIAYAVDGRGLRLDHDYATALSQGHPIEAGRLMARAMLSDSWLRWASPALGTVMGLMLRSSREHEQFASDVMVEAEAELLMDARPVLPRIKVPVLLIGGDEDFYFPVSMIEQTARLIPDCTLKIYRGKGHVGAIRSGQLATDILEFVDRESAPAI